MEIHTITGVGCFGKPETLNRVLKRILEHVIPQQKNQFDPIGCQPDKHLSILRMLRDTFTPPTGSKISERLQTMECKHITGFFVWLKDCCLAISIFIRDDWRDRYIFTVRLNGSSAFQDDSLNQWPVPWQNALFRTFEQTVKNVQGTQPCPELGSTGFLTDAWAFDCAVATQPAIYSCITPSDGNRCTSQDRSGPAYSAET